MSCIHYKFRSALEYDTITFDGLSISLADLKHSIIAQKKFAKNTDFDLEVTNAQTKEQYKDDMTMIPKNSSVVVRRIPIGTKSKAQLAAERSSPFSSGEQKTSTLQDYQVPKTNKLSKVADLANADASEEDKLKAMMKQSGEDWDPSQYVRGRRPYAPGVPVPQNYVCYRCGKPGHFIRNCPTNGDNRFDVPKAKRTTGIPRTFLGTTSEGTASPPTRVSPSLPDGDSKTKAKDKDSSSKKVPSELRCPSCSNLLTDAVLIPCCGTSYCDDCIRNYLLENEQECPSCGAENVSPDSLVINKQLRQAVNTFKNARPASPYVTPVTKSAVVANKNTEVKSQPSSKDVADSVSDKTVSESKPAVENKVVKEINDNERKTRESSPKPPQVVNPPASEPQPIRVHHRDAMSQQGAGFKPAGAPFDPRRRQGDFHPRGAPRVPDVRHGLPEPVIPHGLPPDHVPRVPAVRPNMPGPSHLRPRMNVPGYMPVMHAAIPAPAVPRIPPVPTMVRPALPHHPAFGAPVFDPLHPVDVSRSLTPPMSEREFYKMQKKLKSRKKKHEHPSSSYPSRESRSRKEPKKDTKKDPASSLFDFDDELSEYRKLQKSRQRLRSRSLTPSRSRSRSPSRSRSRSRSRSISRSRSRSLSHSSQSPARSPTPEGWDESRSPSPSSSRGKAEAGSAEEKKRKHKKRKKEQKGKERKKQKTSHAKEGEPSTEQKEKAVADKNAAKSSEKKKHKRPVRDNASNKKMEEEKDTGKVVGKEKDVKEVKEKRKEKVKEKEKGKKKEKERKKSGDKEKGKEKEEKKSKEKKKKKDKSKKDETSSGKKRKNKKKHKKHKRHKKEKSKDEKGGEEEETSDSKAKKSDDPGVSAGDENPDEKNSTEEQETHDTDEGAQQDESEEEENESSDEGMSGEDTKEEDDDEEERKEMEERVGSEEKEEIRSGEIKSNEKVDEDGKKETEKSIGSEEEMMCDEEQEGGKKNKHGKKVANESEDEKLGISGSDGEEEVDEEQLLGNGSDDNVEAEEKLTGNGCVKDKEAEVEIDHTKLEENGSCGEIENGNNVENKGFGGKDDRFYGIESGRKDEVLQGNERQENKEADMKSEEE